jgi:STE24 endopeptidase
VLWFFERYGPAGWLTCWAATTVVQGCVAFLAPAVILPLFNRYTPLPEGELKAAIESYARSQRFRLRGIYTMDGSRRTARTNAFFTGFGRFRRIVLFDTLVARHPVPELLAIVGHEMGHWRRHHVALGMLGSVLIAGLTFFLFSLTLGSRVWSEAFGVREPSVHAALAIFGILYMPLGTALAVLENGVSRRLEFAADAYAVRTAASPADTIAALRRLSVDNLANLTPHPWKVFFDYSHPPVLQRIAAIRELAARGGGTY